MLEIWYIVFDSILFFNKFQLFVSSIYLQTSSKLLQDVCKKQ